jgi:hypothetical protein
VPEELVGTKVLDVDIDQLAAAAIDGVAAHHLDVVGDIPVAAVAHVDSAPHRRIFEEVAPRRAHHLHARQDLGDAQSQQDRRRHVAGQLQPIGELVCQVRRRFHREIFTKKLIWGAFVMCLSITINKLYYFIATILFVESF